MREACFDVNDMFSGKMYDDFLSDEYLVRLEQLISHSDLFCAKFLYRLLKNFVLILTLTNADAGKIILNSASNIAVSIIIMI